MHRPSPETETSKDTEYKTVRGLTRGLLLLNTLNRQDGGCSSSELARLTGLHRTTVRRLLETLQDEGYVRRSRSDDRYQLTLKVRELSEGFRDEQWISALAAPLLADLLPEVVWPTDLCTLDVDAMVVRETTHRFSRLSFHRSMVGRRLPILFTAAGRAYLAFCPEAERQALLELLASRQDRQGELARDPEYVARILLQTRQRGYGSNYSEWDEEQKIAAIALPIFREEKVVGVLNLVYIAKAMLPEEAARKHLAKMRETVEKIESHFTTTNT
ncbi:DNA-binding transcriptional regulator [Nitrincola tapanii]|uniref:DNA-binding transcriptional activator MhpR n=1 Tax=Nitrincola tapanii TaxID=1708751 RepID=A0A5A9W619_9GAMM|nr:DNA-binding transcriptional regulator [Nitrincola tapanii]KAA0875635.1 DNA-binding transcriptional activator MhpR [Nitrincola tapanii]